MICKICDKEIESRPLATREMMFGIRSTHTYLECSNCDALQIQTVPQNLHEYYPENYYSFEKQPEPHIRSTFLRKVKSSRLLYGKHKLLGWLLSIGYKVPEHTTWLKLAGVKHDDAILDVGSGSGDILAHYCKAGFTNLQGIDPFLLREFKSSNGRLRLLRKSIFDVQEPDIFDFIILNHSFEHMDEPQLVINRLSKLIKPGKYLLIRTPINKSYASRKYGTNWVDWDPPRHLVVQSIKSMNILANRNHFVIERIVFDSTAFQFWGSEQYEMGVPLHDPKSYAINKATKLFSQLQIEQWEKQATELNEKAEGDQASFYLRRK